MPPRPDSHGFLSLWPTTVLQRHLPSAEVANQALSALILERDAANRAMTVSYRAGNLFEETHPAIAWLRDCTNRTVVDYLRHAGIDYDVKWGLQAWANVNRFGDYHDPHNHPHCYLSGTYYVAVPTDTDAPDTRGDGRPGQISFYDPRAAANMGAIRGDAHIEAEHTVLPVPGMILLWPAHVMHFVHPNLSRHPRISISFNVVLKWSDAYLPRQ